MFREMRRFGQKMDNSEALALLRQAPSGVLGLQGDNGYPYGIPMNHVFYNGKLVFHSAVNGHKVDAIDRSDKACYTVIAQDTVVPEQLTTYYRSVVVFGRVHYRR